MTELSEDHVIVTKASERIESLAGILIAFFAAALAISDLIGSNYEEEKYKCDIKHSENFSWYQSKSMKQTMLENHLNFLSALQLQGTSLKKAYIDSMIMHVEADIIRYKKDKKEILLGSKNIPKEEWSQDLDGKMGVVVGVKEWEQSATRLERAISKFDISQLFFQICLVLGATCIVIIDNPKLQNGLLLIMICFGLIGICFACYGWLLA